MNPGFSDSDEEIIEEIIPQKKKNWNDRMDVGFS